MESRYKYLLLIMLSCGLQLTAAPIIGYGSSDAVLPAKNQELFFMGFEAGLKKSLKGRSMSSILAVDQVSSGAPLGAIESAERLIAKGVQMLVGYPTSHEALLVGRIAGSKGMLAVFSGAGHSELAKMGPTVFTTGEAMEQEIRKMLLFVKRRFPKKKGVLIVNPFAVFSKNAADVFAELLLQPKFQNVQLVFMHVDIHLTLKASDVESIKNGGIDYLVITPYPDESVKMLGQLNNAGIDLPILSNSSWTTGDVEFIRRFLASRKSVVFSATPWLEGSPESLPFEKTIKDSYGRSATAEIAWGYDLGIIVGTTVNLVKGTPTKKKIVEAFRNKRCFDGLTVGRVCFSPAGGHAEKKKWFVQYTKSGFIPVH